MSTADRVIIENLQDILNDARDLPTVEAQYEQSEQARGQALTDLAAEKATNATLSGTLGRANAENLALITQVTGLEGSITVLKAEIKRLQAIIDAGPVAPKPTLLFGHFDSGRGGEGPGANTVVETDMVAAMGDGKPVSQVFRAYNNQRHPATWTDGANTAQQAAVLKIAGVLNAGFGGDYDGLLAGKYDSVIDSFWNSVPQGLRFYVTVQHEPENDPGIDSTKWCKAVAYYVNRVAPIIRSRGLNAGVGGLLMGAWTVRDQATFEKWNWVKYVTPVNLPQAVYMMDDYAKHLTATTTYSVTPDWNRIFGYARAAGATRFLVGETAISREKLNAGGELVGSTAGQEAWIRREVPLWRKIEGLEVVLYFHKPTGPASKNSQLTGTALKAWAEASRGLF